DQNIQTNIPSIDSFNDKTFIINQSVNHGKIFSEKPGYFYLNNETFVHPTNTSLLSLLLFNNSKEFHLPSAFQVEADEIIDIVINNIDFAPDLFHLHGYHVWILAHGNSNDGYLNQSKLNTIAYNEISPIYRDTFTVNPFSYLVFRFKTDNPGSWMMHCHNDWHVPLGMAAVLIE
ncbi:unnamed protein product, partial [Rotaria sp. Silwood2]